MEKEIEANEKKETETSDVFDGVRRTFNYLKTNNFVSSLQDMVFTMNHVTPILSIDTPRPRVRKRIPSFIIS